MVGRPDLRLIVVTDAALAAPRAIADVVRQSLAAGAPAIQLRAKTATPREMLEQALVLLPLTRAHGALLFINDRLDIALAAGADGVHIGPDDLPIAAARRAAPHLLIGCSTDNPTTARAAERDGADYIGCGAVFGTTTKHDVGDERIGTARLRAVVDAVTIPVVGIGGINVSNVQEVAGAGAAGCAVVGAVMQAEDVSEAVQQLLQAWQEPALPDDGRQFQP